MAGEMAWHLRAHIALGAHYSYRGLTGSITHVIFWVVRGVCARAHTHTIIQKHLERRPSKRYLWKAKVRPD